MTHQCHVKARKSKPTKNANIYRRDVCFFPTASGSTRRKWRGGRISIHLQTTFSHPNLNVKGVEVSDKWRRSRADQAGFNYRVKKNVWGTSGVRSMNTIKYLYAFFFFCSGIAGSDVKFLGWFLNHYMVSSRRDFPASMVHDVLKLWGCGSFCHSRSKD